ncbi:MAG: hypothetical protein QOH97_3052, partial [Actinoplanes sp.]|nr:hypothetical protein [Actinoplanes sp.]
TQCRPGRRGAPVAFAALMSVDSAGYGVLVKNRDIRHQKMI